MVGFPNLDFSRGESDIASREAVASLLRIRTPEGERFVFTEVAMRRLLGGLVVVAAVTGMAVWAVPVLLLIVVAAAAGTAFWWFSRCHHPRPLGLLPPMVDEQGVLQPAQWYCGNCGYRFPADFIHERAPVPRFTGYDETKSVVSARRAADLEQSQRRLAVKRAGLGSRGRVAAPSGGTAARPEPVSIDSRRRAG